MEYLYYLSIIFLNLFLIAAAADGLYFHLWKYKLHLRRESTFEHKLHTIRAFLFIPVLFFLFFMDFGGLALWAGIAFIMADLIVEMVDVFSEKSSRASLGGLSSAEYAIHIAATTLRIAAVSFILAAKPAAAWDFGSPIVMGEYPSAIKFAAINTMAGNLGVGILHLLVMSKAFRGLKVFRCCSG